MASSLRAPPPSNMRSDMGLPQARRTRVLRAWGNPMSDRMFEGGGARSDEAMLETVVPVREIKSNIAKLLHPLIASLFERFGATGLSVERVEEEIEKMKKN